VGEFCSYVNDILLTSHTHDDAHGLVPTRLIVDIGYIVAYTILKLIVKMV
jgi:hypothetical protein